MKTSMVPMTESTERVGIMVSLGLELGYFGDESGGDDLD